MRNTKHVFSTLHEACEDVGIMTPRTLQPGFTVTPTKGEHSSKTGGRVLQFPGATGGIAFNWVAHTYSTFFYDYESGKKLTKAQIKERDAMVEQYIAEEMARQAKMHRHAATLAERLMQASVGAEPDHRYLKTKHIGFAGKEHWVCAIDRRKASALLLEGAHEAGTEPQYVSSQIGGELLVIPLSDDKQHTVSVQFIDAFGRKTFLKGGQTKGAVWMALMGGREHNYGGEVALCEGVATAISIARIQRIPAVSAMNAGNLSAALETMTRLYPKAKYSIFADQDANAVGYEAAKAAVKRFPKTEIYLPDFTKEDIENFHRRARSSAMPTDYNDLYIARGIL